jgi:hypothetical protein
MKILYEIVTTRTLLGAIAILLAISQQVSSQTSNQSGLHFEDKSELLEFRRAGGEGLGGAAWLDFDNDGDLDLFLTNGRDNNRFNPEVLNNGLFRNNNDGTFTDVASEAGVENGFGNSCIVAGDIDNDGYTDIFLCGEGRFAGPFQSLVKLYHNNGDGTFRDITWRAGVWDLGKRSEASVAMADINNDGYLDLFIASPGHIPFFRGFGQGEAYPNKLYLNNGDLTFTNIARSAGVDGLYEDEATGQITSDGACAVGFSDYNRDNLVDIIVANCNAFNLQHRTPGVALFRATPFNLYRNNGDLTFTDVAPDAGLDILGFWMGLAIGDFDNDGNIDFFASSSSGVDSENLSTGEDVIFPHALMRNNGDGTFTDIAGKELAENPFSWGTSAADFDNDGDLDLFKTGSLPTFGVIGSQASPGEFFRNEGDAGFVRDFDATDIDLSGDYASGVAQADFNGDGFPDIVAIRSAFQVFLPIFDFIFDLPNGQPVLLENKGNSNGWLTIRLIGTNSNQMGIGARIEVFTPSHSLAEKQVREVRAGSSFASSESPWPTFGLGSNPGDSIVTVRWPSGLVEVFSSVSPGQIYDVVEGSGTPQ